MILNIHPEYMEHGSASPGVCYFCHAAKRPGEVIVDFHLQVDVAVFDGTAMDGWLQACSTCMAEVGRAIGMESADKVEQLRADRDFLADDLADVEAKLDAANTALDALGLYAAKPRKVRDEDDE